MPFDDTFDSLLDWNNDDIDIQSLTNYNPAQTKQNSEAAITTTPAAALHDVDVSRLARSPPLLQQDTPYVRTGISLSTDTIFQLSSGLGPFSTGVGVAIIRISGSSALAALLSITNLKQSPKARYATVCSVFDVSSAARPLVDHNALCLYFAGPKSFTGEDVVEIHTHGNPLTVAAVLRSLGSIPNLRLAEAGEFTRRAFLHNKMDLPQVEGLGDVLRARTERQHKQALSQLRGANSFLYNKWRREITECLAYVESVIDFGEDEADIAEEEIIRNVLPRVHVLARRLRSHLADGRRGETLRRGLKMTIFGAPNAGKSSLLNALSQKEIAIVSSIPGTTRDVVQTSLDIAGWPVIVADTAGLRETTDLVEREGVRRAKALALDDDLRVVLFDGAIVTEIITRLGLVGGEKEGGNTRLLYTELVRALDPLSSALVDDKTVVVVTKADALPLSAAFSAPKMKTQQTADPIFHSEFTLVKEAQRREREEARAEDLADLQLLFRDAEKAMAAQNTVSRGFQSGAEEEGELGEAVRGGLVSVPWEEDVREAFRLVFPTASDICLLSCKMEYNMSGLLEAVDALARKKFDSKVQPGEEEGEEESIASEAVVMNLRHRQNLEKTLMFLEMFTGEGAAFRAASESKFSHFRALENSGVHPAARQSTIPALGTMGQNQVQAQASHGVDLVLAAEHLRLAAHHMGCILGAVDTEELLDVIFNDFCIGK